MKKIKVLLVDDQILFAQSLHKVLESNANNIELTGIAYSGQEAFDLIEKNKPDIILIDIRMPGMNGVECTKKIKKKNPEISIIVLTIFDDDEYIIEALKCGASGYLLKDVPISELIVSIEAASEGSVQISPKIAERIVSMITQQKKMDIRNTDRISSIDCLSVREKEILCLLANGHRNKEIADRLYITEQTVKNHVHTIYSKIGVGNRAQAVSLYDKLDIDK